MEASVKIYLKTKDSIVRLCVGICLICFSMVVFHGQLTHSVPERNREFGWYIFFVVTGFSLFFLINALSEIGYRHLPIIEIAFDKVTIRRSTSATLTEIPSHDIDDVFMRTYATKVGRQYILQLRLRGDESVKEIHVTCLTESPDKILQTLREAVARNVPINAADSDRRSVQREKYFRETASREFFRAILVAVVLLLSLWLFAK